MPDIDFGQLSEALNDKMDRGGMNAQSPCAVVVAKQDPTADNNYTWYRKYSDGWVEQGGLQTSASGSSGVTVTLPVAMADANYTITATVTGEQAYFVGCLNKTTTSFLWRSFNTSTQGYDKAGSWQVSGIAA